MKVLSDFSYSLNKEVKNFIHNMVYSFERIDLARIYLIYVILRIKEIYL